MPLGLFGAMKGRGKEAVSLIFLSALKYLIILIYF